MDIEEVESEKSSISLRLQAWVTGRMMVPSIVIGKLGRGEGLEYVCGNKKFSFEHIDFMMAGIHRVQNIQ